MTNKKYNRVQLRNKIVSWAVWIEERSEAKGVI